jgi:hypothetical protein
MDVKNMSMRLTIKNRKVWLYKLLVFGKPGIFIEI